MRLDEYSCNYMWSCRSEADEELTCSSIWSRDGHHGIDFRVFAYNLNYFGGFRNDCLCVGGSFGNILFAFSAACGSVSFFPLMEKEHLEEGFGGNLSEDFLVIGGRIENRRPTFDEL